ncbi:MAG: hypothetical protein ABIH76_01105 [Candidatus Bathyarchaeota archaeon]
MDYDALLHSIHDNLPYQYKDPEEVAIAYNRLSSSDIFIGRIKRTQNWGLLGYALEQMTIGVASVRTRRYAPVTYRFPPDKFLILSRTRVKRELRNNLCSHICAKCHVSRKIAAKDFLPFLHVIFKNNSDMASEIASWLELDERMIAYLAGKEIVTKRVVRNKRVRKRD